jgi:hypothetical protein
LKEVCHWTHIGAVPPVESYGHVSRAAPVVAGGSAAFFNKLERTRDRTQRRCKAARKAHDAIPSPPHPTSSIS